MDCSTCGAPSKEIATKTIGRSSDAIAKCRRLECGHAWHETHWTDGNRSGGSDAGPTACGCREIVTLRELLIAGRQLGTLKDDVSSEAFRDWSLQVLAALDGIPAEAGAPSLLRRATTAAKPSEGGLAKKVTDLNALLVRAIVAVT